MPGSGPLNANTAMSPELTDNYLSSTVVENGGVKSEGLESIVFLTLIQGLCPSSFNHLSCLHSQTTFSSYVKGCRTWALHHLAQTLKQLRNASANACQALVKTPRSVPSSRPAFEITVLIMLSGLARL